MAKRAQSLHGKALAAFTVGLITRAEYQDCCVGRAFVSGSSIHFTTRRLIDGRFAWWRPLVRRQAAQ